MKTTTILAVLAMAFLVLAPSRSEAQLYAPQPYGVDSTVLAQPELGDSLDAIDAESRAATALYITASVSFGVGALTAVIAGFIAGIQNVWSGTDNTPAAATAVTGAVVAGLGFLTFIPAIVLDVDSGVRRRNLADSGGRTRLVLGPGSLSLAGTF